VDGDGGHIGVHRDLDLPVNSPVVAHSHLLHTQKSRCGMCFMNTALTLLTSEIPKLQCKPGKIVGYKCIGKLMQILGVDVAVSV